MRRTATCTQLTGTAPSFGAVCTQTAPRSSSGSGTPRWQRNAWTWATSAPIWQRRICGIRARVRAEKRLLLSLFKNHRCNRSTNNNHCTKTGSGQTRRKLEQEGVLRRPPRSVGLDYYPTRGADNAARDHVRCCSQQAELFAAARAGVFTRRDAQRQLWRGTRSYPGGRPARAMEQLAVWYAIPNPQPHYVTALRDRIAWLHCVTALRGRIK